ncbi:Trm112 family protein [Pseudacidobacterium ailaaui]|uniref:Trm112 family protein n=1 Tax=Pseudacidobacterium ailaaui TaxID=1382359 RepID=UPI0009DEAADF
MFMVKDAYTVLMPAPVLSPEILSQLVCPVCHGSLAWDENAVLCRNCGRKYPIEDNIPVLLAERAL